MINKTIDIHEIRYGTKDPGKLLESTEKRGIAIPGQVNVTEDGYQCIDGNRRLSACAVLAEKNTKFNRIPVMILNDYSKAGSAFWGNTQNKH